MRNRKHVIRILIVALMAALACAFELPKEDRPKMFLPPLKAQAFDAAKPHSHTPPQGLIVYSQSEPHKADETELFSIFCRNLPGNGKPVQLAGAKENGNIKFADIRDVKLSPDGGRALFLGLPLPPCGYVSLNNDTYLAGYDIYIADIASRKVRDLSKEGYGYFDANWSSDGKWVSAYTWYGGSMPDDPTSDTGLYVFEASGSRVFNPVRYTNNGWIIASAVQPGRSGEVMFSRKTLALGGKPDSNLYSVPCEGGSVTTVIEGGGQRINYCFSPDGKHVSYVQNSVLRDGNVYRPNRDAVFYAANADGSFPVAMAGQTGRKDPSDELSPGKWSPDSSRFAFVEIYTPSMHSEATGRVHVFDLITRKDKIVVDKAPELIGWSKDGQWVIVRIPEPAGTGANKVAAVCVADGNVEELGSFSKEVYALSWCETRSR